MSRTFALRSVRKSLSWIVCLAIASLALSGAATPASAATDGPTVTIIADFNTTLQPGDWQGWWISRPSLKCAYVVEVTPLQPSVDGATIEKAIVQAEYDGAQWNDVLRVIIPAGNPALDVNIRVYRLTGFPIVKEIVTILQPGEWRSFIVGPSPRERGYLSEISPIGSSIWSPIDLFQVRFNGERWRDVLRVQLPVYNPTALEVNIRVYRTARLPVVSEFTAKLEPGVWHGWALGPSSANGAFIPEISPLRSSVEGARIERHVVQPEFDGVQWNDVLRVQIPAGDPALKVNIRLYGLTPPTTGIEMRPLEVAP